MSAAKPPNARSTLLAESCRRSRSSRPSAERRRGKSARAKAMHQADKGREGIRRDQERQGLAQAPKAPAAQSLEEARMGQKRCCQAPAV